MTTEPRSVNDGSLLVGVKATPSGWPTASLDPDSGDRRRARSGARRVYKPQKLVFTVSGDCPAAAWAVRCWARSAAVRWM
jgi:hypothetical protein